MQLNVLNDLAEANKRRTEKNHHEVCVFAVIANLSRCNVHHGVLNDLAKANRRGTEKTNDMSLTGGHP